MLEGDERSSGGENEDGILLIINFQPQIKNLLQLLFINSDG